MRSTIENLLMSVGTIYTINERTILKRMQKMNEWLSSFMMNQATPHLGGTVVANVLYIKCLDIFYFMF
jgi:hypothetical protein